MARCSDMAGLERWLKLARWLRERDLTCVAGKHASSNPYQRPAASFPLSQNHHHPPTVLLHSAKPKRKVCSRLSSRLPVSQPDPTSVSLHSARVRHVNLCTQQ